MAKLVGDCGAPSGRIAKAMREQDAGAGAVDHELRERPLERSIDDLHAKPPSNRGDIDVLERSHSGVQPAGLRSCDRHSFLRCH